jgi:cold shock CspA family protein
LRGTIKFFDGRKGFGFIRSDAGEEFFVCPEAIDVECRARLTEDATFARGLPVWFKDGGPAR